MKRIGAFAIALWLLLTVCSVGVAAEKNPTIVLSEVQGMPGRTVSVTIRLENNPGLISAKVRVGYDTDALELVGCDWGGFPAQGYSTGKLENQPFVVNFCDAVAASNYTSEEFATLHFRIREDAAPDVYPLTMTCDFEGDFFNFDWEAVYFDLDQGRITVVPAADPVAPTTSATTVPHTTVTDGTADTTAPTSTASTAAITDGTAAIGAQTTHRPTTSTSSKMMDIKNKLSSFGSAGLIVPLIAVVILVCFIAILAICKKKK